MKQKKEFSERSTLFKIYFNIMTSGKYPNGYVTTDDILPGTQYLLMNALILIGGLGMTAFSAINFSRYVAGDAQSFGSFLTDFILVLTLIPTMFIARIKKVKRIFPSAVAVGAYFILCWIFGYFKLTGVVSPLVYFIQPLIASYLLGIKLGGIFMTLSYGVLIYTFVTTGLYSAVEATSYLGVLTMITSFSFVTQKQLLGLFSLISDKTKQMQEEHEEMTLMKDGLDLGIFFLNSEGEIQPLYSKPLPTILGKKDLDHIKLVDLFSKTLKQKDLDLLHDYFNMLSNASSFNLELLDDINPLNKTIYITESGEEKTLVFTFAPLEKGDNKLLLSTVRDITYQAQMEARIEEEENVRQEEMKTMFEIMHSPPDILNEYLDEASYEFDSINETLKNKNLSRTQILTEVFQSIHSIKSNAYIIGLETTGNKLHEFETKINTLLDKGQIEYEDILSVTFELNKILSFNDSFRQTLEKLAAFSSENPSSNIQKEIFIKTINSTLNRALVGTNKKAEFELKDFNWDSAQIQVKRTIKEILIQFIRNSVYHGIEDCDERIAKNKSESGLLTISINETENQFVLEYSDDGKGIDFVKILTKSKEKKLVSEDTTIDNKNELLRAMMSPRFSTADDVNDQAGRGVGLSLVSDKISKNKGTLKIQSKQGSGTKFIITLPKTN